jgi:hypothetical protein
MVHMKTKPEQTLTARLTAYAQKTATEMNGTLPEGIRVMEDEADEVALAVGCRTSEVEDWCRWHLQGAS